ncbi:hypothetical protein EJB05_34271, partial [Eragrostis curvula]
LPRPPPSRSAPAPPPRPAQAPSSRRALASPPGPHRLRHRAVHLLCRLAEERGGGLGAEEEAGGGADASQPLPRCPRPAPEGGWGRRFTAAADDGADTAGAAAFREEDDAAGPPWEGAVDAELGGVAGAPGARRSTRTAAAPVPALRMEERRAEKTGF